MNGDFYQFESWSKKQIEVERNYRFQERLGMLIGTDAVTNEAVELAGAVCRAWEREMDFTRQVACAVQDLKAGQMEFL